MNGQAIPGFYYDPEKRKYFKIQSATASRDLNLKYSAQNLRKQERLDRLHNHATKAIQKTRKERVVRRHASTLIQSNIDREIGAKRLSFYAHNAWPGACISGFPNEPISICDNSSLRYFDCDPVSRTIYAVLGDNRIHRLQTHGDKNDGPPLPDANLDLEDYCDQLPIRSYPSQPWEQLQRTTSTISSLTYLPTSGALAATTYGSDRPPVVWLSDPERDGPYIGQQFTPKGCNVIWSAAARPTNFANSTTNSIAASQTEHLAVAASNLLLLFIRAQTGSWDSSIAVGGMDSDIIALDWVSHSTVAMGNRDGKIHLYDSRSGGSSHILTHPYSVAKIKRADDPTRFVVSGLNDSCCLYDIRMSRATRSKKDSGHYSNTYFESMQSHHPAKRKKLMHLARTRWSQPVVAFHHANLDDSELDVAVHDRLGLVAAAQDHEAQVVIRISNLWTGKVVKEISRKESRYRGTRGNQKIRSLKFVDGGADGGVELWSTWSGAIAKFGW